MEFLQLLLRLTVGSGEWSCWIELLCRAVPANLFILMNTYKTFHLQHKNQHPPANPRQADSLSKGWRSLNAVRNFCTDFILDWFCFSPLLHECSFKGRKGMKEFLKYKSPFNGQCSQMLYILWGGESFFLLKHGDDGNGGSRLSDCHLCIPISQILAFFWYLFTPTLVTPNLGRY